MLNIKGAKTDMLKNQAQAFLDTLAKVLDVDANDLEVKVACELEFYILDKDGQKLTKKFSCQDVEIKQIIQLLQRFDELKKNTSQALRLESFEEEDGHNQFEVQFFPTNDPIELAENVCNFKNEIEKVCLSKGLSVNFQAKPFDEEPTSSMHFHISVYHQGENLFSKDNPYDDDEYHYLPLYWCIAGLLALAPKFMKFFSPTANCRERYCVPKSEQKFIHYPTHLCWGFNNRTCAIRIPRKPSEDPKNCRIEHRLSSSMADPYLSLFAIFAGMQYGVAQKMECPEPVYGRAFEDDEAGKLIYDCF